MPVFIEQLGALLSTLEVVAPCVIIEHQCGFFVKVTLQGPLEQRSICMKSSESQFF